MLLEAGPREYRIPWIRSHGLKPASIFAGLFPDMAMARKLSEQEGEREMGDYTLRHPTPYCLPGRKALGKEVRGESKEFAELASRMPFVELRVENS
jgi:hypothetical protein